MLDDTPLPALVADYRGFRVSEELSLEQIAIHVVGTHPDREVARLLQDRLLEMTAAASTIIDPLPYLVCPNCGSPKLDRGEYTDYERDDQYFVVRCNECNWSDSTEL